MMRLEAEHRPNQSVSLWKMLVLGRPEKKPLLNRWLQGLLLIDDGLLKQCIDYSREC